MAKFISIARKSLESLFKKAVSNQGDDLVNQVRKAMKAGSEGKVILPKTDFVNLARVAGMRMDEATLARMKNTAGRKINEVRASRGKGPMSAEKISEIGRVKSGLPKRGFNRGNPDFKSGNEYLRQKQSEQGY